MLNSDYVDVGELRSEVRSHYAEVADRPDGEFHFHTGRFARLSSWVTTRRCSPVCRSRQSRPSPE